MVEYGLLFGLGFLTAILVGLLLAPAIHNRIVRYTENRMLATVPLSSHELRAQKDMVRAEMAVEVVRTCHDLKLERHKAAEFSITRDRIAAEVQKLHGLNSDLVVEIEDLRVEMQEMASTLRNGEIRVVELREALQQSQHSDTMKETRIDELLHHAHRLTGEIDTLKIDLTTRETEAEGLRIRINGLRDERETLRNDLRQMIQRAKDAELKLAREENRANRLEERLTIEMEAKADRDVLLERRGDEISRVKDRLKAANAEIREKTRAAKSAKETKPALIDKTLKMREISDGSLLLPSEIEKKERVAASAIVQDAREADRLIDDVRERARQFSEQLAIPGSTVDDDDLREELGTIAAKMIASSIYREGASSPVRAMVSGKNISPDTGRKSLAERVQDVLQQEKLSG